MKTKLASTVAALALIAGLGLAPVLSSAPAYAVDNMTSTDAPDLTSVRTKIKAKDYAGALAELRELADDVQHADVYNLMGYTLRKTGDFKTSLTYYTKAIEMQPEHKAAREYLGELYVETGNMEKAKEQLAVLAKLCPAAARSARICKRRSTLNRPATDGKEKRAPARPLLFSRSRPLSPDRLHSRLIRRTICHARRHRPPRGPPAAGVDISP